jgi:hypothetical protein
MRYPPWPICRNPPDASHARHRPTPPQPRPDRGRPPNGARSRGPITPEGKARSSRNALKHGLAALHHFVLEDEAPSELEELTARLLVEVEPQSEIEARLVKRIAIAFWKSERAERIEVALFDAAPKLRPPQAGFAWEEADPLTTFDLKRFNAVRGYQAQQGRELSRCLKQLRLLRREPLVDGTDEPESMSPNEPERPPEPANDDAGSVTFIKAVQLEGSSRNEPAPPTDAVIGLTDPRPVVGSRLHDIWGPARPQGIEPDRLGGGPSVTGQAEPGQRALAGR